MRGRAVVLTALLVIGGGGLSIDAALWQVNQRSMQGAADQASMAGVNAYVLAGNTGAVATDPVAQQAALAVAASFGYPACSQTPDNGCPCTSGKGACAGIPVNPTSKICQSNPAGCLQVVITQSRRRFLSRIVNSAPPVAAASAAVASGWTVQLVE